MAVARRRQWPLRLAIKIVDLKDSETRCPWVDITKPGYPEYHDVEWGVPVYDDHTLFEFVTLEAAQAGLSWYTVLRKRENYRRAFADFDVKKVAQFKASNVKVLMNDAGIIRNRLKIEAAISNARQFMEVQAEFGTFSSYIWRFVHGRPVVNRLEKLSDYQATTKQSDAVAKDLKVRGFKFFGSTIAYAYMQATGLVNDHTLECYRRREIINAYS